MTKKIVKLATLVVLATAALAVASLLMLSLCLAADDLPTAAPPRR